MYYFPCHRKHLIPTTNTLEIIFLDHNVIHQNVYNRRISLKIPCLKLKEIPINNP